LQLDKLSASCRAPQTGPLLLETVKEGNVEPAALTNPKDVVMSHNPQDIYVMPASTTTVEAVGDEIATTKVRLRGELAPNTDGSFIFPETDDRFTTACAFSSVANAVAFTEKTWGRSLVWATGRPQLNVTADAGQDFNAYYDRDGRGLYFFHDVDPVTQKTVYSGRSGEVTAHEAFHAILDAERPQYLRSFVPDVGAFHESMGDIGALSLSLQNPQVLDEVLRQTGGDLSKQNCAAALGEELGLALSHEKGTDITGGAWTRNALNSFQWSEPTQLPAHAGPGSLSREVHSLSRLWTGAAYDVLTGIVNGLVAQGADPRSALQEGGLELLKMQGRLLAPGMAPDGGFTFADMAKAWVRSDNELNGGKYAGLITKVMQDRRILDTATELVDELPPSGIREVSITLDEQFGLFQGCKVSSVMSGAEVRDKRILEEDASHLQRDMAQLIESGDILYVPAGESPSGTSLLKPDGEPYRGVVRWENGQPIIQPTFIVG
jgi:hypothetical protein